MSAQNNNLPPPPDREYILHIPDLPNVHSKRLALLKQHNEDSAPLVIAGRVPFFGSTLAQHGTKDEQPVENGTIMVIKAQNEDQIRETIKQDVFTMKGVWDFEHMTIWPFHSK